MTSNQVQHLTTALAGRYRVVREIGRGGMATVYRADDPKHPRQVAITVFDARYAEVLGKDRFLREIEVTAGLRFLESLRGDAEYEALISGLTHDGCEGTYAGSVRFYRGGRR